MTQHVDKKQSQGIQSIEIGYQILKKVAEANRPIGITELAALCEMSKSKLHRYLTSLCRVGLLKKGIDARYTLGTNLLLLGLQASEQLDIQRIAEPIIQRLSEELNETVGLAIWGQNGPLFIRWQESSKTVNIGIRVGSYVSLTTSATGKIFAAYAYDPEKEILINKELSASGVEKTEFESEINEVRARGYATTYGGFIPGIVAVAAPVFGQDETLVAALTIVGAAGGLDINENSKAVRLILKQAQALSKELGFPGV